MKRCRRSVSTAKETVDVVDIEDITFTSKEIQEIRASLLQWYDKNRRDLPWRRINNGGDEVGIEERERRAYAVWVSEVMLQQTRVQTVIDYFNRWMKKWPTIHHLAQATIEEVNEMWAGLGYYRRARFLLEGAKMIVEGGDEFPKTASSLRMVKGIGNYTAGAIASIAFEEAVPVVDGNVVRVMTRLKAITANPKNSTTVKNIWKLAGQLVDPLRPGDFNQAVMELGATMCSPSAPSCSQCPISRQCQALSLSMNDESVKVSDYPMKVAKAKQRHDFSAVSVVEIVEEGSQSDNRYLLVKRPDEGLLAGLWEFPSVLLEGEADLTSRRKAINSFLKQSFGLDMKKSCKVVLREEVGVYVHIFSHIRLKMYVELLVLHLTGGTNFLQKKQEETATIKWKYVDNEALSTLGLTSGVRKVCTMIQKFKQDGSSPVSATARKRRDKRELKTRFLQIQEMATTGGSIAAFSCPSYFCQKSRATSSLSLVVSVISRRRNTCCLAVQESSTTSTVAAETKEKKEVEEDATTAASNSKPKPAAKAAAKPLPQLMEEDVIPSLKTTLEAQEDISELELSFNENKLEGSFVKKGIPYSFWAFFPDGTINGPKGFSISSYGSGVSTVEPFLVDEKKPTPKHVVFWVEKRLAAQGIIPVWQAW
ncbi:HhH-GPD base excision DNA repair family protein [Perilla frutescens var. hirtella]|nr:HhH-GPD base excision DNA repair family protein [Perilla frutescens var. hirtella]KAH6810899.1 HhH-GPD base excision DNA repair family protein [Perilla frutescens var. frutescens]